MVYELADGTKHAYPFGLVEIRFMGEVTAGRVVFGPDDAEPVLGVTALESVGITIDPANRMLKRLPAIPLKGMMASPLSAIWERVDLRFLQVCGSSHWASWRATDLQKTQVGANRCCGAPRLAYLDETKVSQFVFGKVDECDTRVPIGFQVPEGTLDTVLADTHPPQKVDQVIFSPQVLTRHSSPSPGGTDRGEYNGVTEHTRRLLRRVP
jgi:hypothetical protein